MIRQIILGLVVSACTTNVAVGQVTFFTGKTLFDSEMQARGKMLKAVEDFEGASIGDGAKDAFPAPVEGNVPNVDPNSGVGFPNGLSVKNLIIQDNITVGPSPANLNPSGSDIALYVVGPGFAGANSKKIGEDLEILAGQEASLDLIFTTPKTGVGFELSQFSGFGEGDWTVTVYNATNQVIGTIVVPSALEPNKNFIGVSSAGADIGRINIWDVGIVPDAIDNIQMWESVDTGGIPAVSTWGVAAFALMLLVGAKIYFSRRRIVA